MSRRRVTYALAAIVALGLGLRGLAIWFEPPHHPDEFFQYLEPAWRHLTGVGVGTWEWRSGVRSWVLPGYHGAWMALLLRLGVHDGRTVAKLIEAHWALASLALVFAGWRGGLLLARQRLPPAPTTDEPDAAAPPAGWQGGLLAALLCAAFPLLVRFSVHTLSELPSLLCLTWALVLTGELGQVTPRAKALGLGVLVGLGVGLRIQHAPVALVIGLCLVGRWRALGLVGLGILLSATLFGLVDGLTWGIPFSSFVRYIKFNLSANAADIFGRQPLYWYGLTFFHRLPLGLPVVGLLGLLAVRRSRCFLGSALGLLALLSTQPHKEERFAMLVWPLLLIPAGAEVGGWLAARARRSHGVPPAGRAGAGWRTWLARALAAGFVLLVLADGAAHGRGNDFRLLSPSRFQAQAWVGRQPDVTGLVYDQPLYTGGYLWFGRPFPQLSYRSGRLGNPLVSHVLAPRDTPAVREALGMGFAEVLAVGDILVLRRARGPAAGAAQNRP